jgi:hypothetical protein
MADIVTASGFNRPWDGVYERKKEPSHWVHTSGDYWIWRDSENWYLGASPIKYTEEALKATSPLVIETSPEGFIAPIIDPKGDYTGQFGNPNGVVS